MEDYNSKMAEQFMYMAGRMSKRNEQLDSLLQTSIRIIVDLLQRPNIEDYEDAYNREQEIMEFVNTYQYKPPTRPNTSICDVDDDELPF